MTDPRQKKQPPRQKQEAAPSGDLREAKYRNVGAEGFGLNKTQQEAIADLWRWQQESLSSDIVLGGPIG